MCLGEKNKLLCYYPFVLTFVSTQEQVEKLKNENKSHRKKIEKILLPFLLQF